MGEHGGKLLSCGPCAKRMPYVAKLREKYCGVRLVEAQNRG